MNSEGKVIYWVIYDPVSGEIVMQCANRKEARALCDHDGKIAKVVESH